MKKKEIYLGGELVYTSDDTPDTDSVQPSHYRQGKMDLFETWYLNRYQDKNGIEDLDKASYCIKRLREYEEREANV